MIDRKYRMSLCSRAKALFNAPIGDSVSRHGRLGTFGMAIALAALPAAAGCGAEQAGDATAQGPRTFRVGPNPQNMGGRDHRFLITIPAAYLPAEAGAAGRLPADVSQVRFYADAADFSPTSESPRETPRSVMVSVMWSPDNFVRRRVDGSWLNSFSRYSRPAGSEFGLEVRQELHAPRIPAKLYVALSPAQDLMIECAYLPAARPNLCQMTVKRPRSPLIEIWLDRSQLPRWREISDRAHRLVSQWTS